jgi:hypothetical protein
MEGFWLKGNCWREIAEGGKRIAEGKRIAKEELLKRG